MTNWNHLLDERGVEIARDTQRAPSPRIIKERYVPVARVARFCGVEKRPSRRKQRRAGKSKGSPGRTTDSRRAAS